MVLAEHREVVPALFEVAVGEKSEDVAKHRIPAAATTATVAQAISLGVFGPGRRRTRGLAKMSSWVGLLMHQLCRQGFDTGGVKGDGDCAGLAVNTLE